MTAITDEAGRCRTDHQARKDFYLAVSELMGCALVFFAEAFLFFQLGGIFFYRSPGGWLALDSFCTGIAVTLVALSCWKLQRSLGYLSHASLVERLKLSKAKVRRSKDGKPTASLSTSYLRRRSLQLRIAFCVWLTNTKSRQGLRFFVLGSIFVFLEGIMSKYGFSLSGLDTLLMLSGVALWIAALMKVFVGAMETV